MELRTKKIRYIAEEKNHRFTEKYQIYCGNDWVDIMDTTGFPTVASPAPMAVGGENDGWDALKNLDLTQDECEFQLEKIEEHTRRGVKTIKSYGIGALGKVIREVRLDEAENLAHVTVSFVPSRHNNIVSVEDKLFLHRKQEKIRTEYPASGFYLEPAD